MNMTNSDDKVLIVYHREDNDGVYSAALIYRYLEEKMHVRKENIDTLGADYNMLALMKKSIGEWKEKYTMVVMTDISFNDWRCMAKMKKVFGKKFIWIDHHAPAIAQSVQHGYDDVDGMRETWTSAIGLAYEWLWDPLRVNLSSSSSPRLLQYLAGWDSFNPNAYGLTSNECMEVNLAVNMDTKLSLARALQNVRDIMYGDGTESDQGRAFIDELIEEGHTILEYQKAQWATLVRENAEDGWTVNGRSAVALFCQGASTSIMFESVKENVECAIVFKHAKNGKWSISVYNTNREDDKVFHVGNYLKKVFKVAGGHAGAGGATMSQSAFLRILREKKL